METDFEQYFNARKKVCFTLVVEEFVAYVISFRSVIYNKRHF